MTFVDDKVMISGGISTVGGKHDLVTFQATEMASNYQADPVIFGAWLSWVFNNYEGGNHRKNRQKNMPSLRLLNASKNTINAQCLI